jgi:predicted XRE-type DNA-binding protein
VAEIRALVARGRSQRQIALTYGVNQSQVSKIATNQARVNG